MNGDGSETTYKITITGFKGERYKDRTAYALARVFKNVPEDKIRRRIENLPWTILQRTNLRTAVKIVRLLNKCGAHLAVYPPIPNSAFSQMQATQVLPDLQALSEPAARQDQLPASMSPSRARSEKPEKTPSGSDRNSGIRREKEKQDGGESEHLKTPSKHSTELKVEGPAVEPSGAGTAPILISQPVEPQNVNSNRAWDIGPATISQILDKTFQISKQYFWKLFAINAVEWGLNLLLFTGIAAAALPLYLIFVRTGAPPPLQSIITVVILMLSVVMAAMIIRFLAQGATIYACSSIFLGEDVSVKNAYLFSISKIKELSITSILVFILLSVAFVITIVVFGAVYGFLWLIEEHKGLLVVIAVFAAMAAVFIPVIAMMKMMMVDKVVIIEGTAYIEAIRRSWSLMTGKVSDDWPKSYINRLGMLLFLYFLLAMVIKLAFSIPAQVAKIFVDKGSTAAIVTAILGQVIDAFGATIAAVFLSVALVIFYYDIRSRKEGFDISMLINSTIKPQKG